MARAVIILLAASALLAACVESAKPIESASAEDGGTADANAEAGAPDAGGGVCEKSGDVCGPAEHCCRDVDHVRGMLVDLDRKCYSAQKTLLACRTKTPIGGCAKEPAYDCWTRPLPDGGHEVFLTWDYWQDGMVPGFTRCEPSLSSEVTNLSTTCP